MSFVQKGIPAVGETSLASRGAQQLSVASRVMIAAAVVATSLGCSDQNVSPVAPSFSQAAAVTTPTTLGWQKRARTLVGKNRLSPLHAARVYAALSVAQYDAIDGVSAPDAEEEQGAIAGASSVVLKYFFPAAAHNIDEVVELQAKGGSNTRDPEFMLGLSVGTQAGAGMITRLAADHFTDPWTGTVPTGPGSWINNGPPFLPLFGQVTPYFLTTGSQFRPPPPPAFGSAAFLADLDEIKTLSATRTSEQLASARFWNYPTGTPTPIGHWNQHAGALVETYGVDERSAVHVFALMHSAMMDAAIACWDAKYFYWTLRPSQADAAITLPIGLPNHPSYPSGHSCISSAATTVLAEFFPGEDGQLQAQLTEAGLSRMYGGIHYRFDIDAGAALGRSVAQWAIGIDQSVGLLPGIH
jgi:membrane-associated phospholipid phosphatase